MTKAWRLAGQKRPNSANGVLAWRGLAWRLAVLAVLLGAMVGKLLPTRRPSAGCGIPGHIAGAGGKSAFKTAPRLSAPAAKLLLSLAAVPFAPVGLPVLLSLLGLAGEEKIMENTTLLFRNARYFVWWNVS